MHMAIEVMLRRYNCRTPTDYKNALKEIMQEIALLGLSRQNFFQSASFYGGTALRIAHQLGRFSEDLDFTLERPDNAFDITPYLKGVEEEFSAYGLKLTAEKRSKVSASDVDSAFLKANTLEHLLMIEGVKGPVSGTNKNDLIKIKLEVDTNPPLPTGKQEVLFLLEPIPFSYRILTLPSLFGGKLHALICREYKGGRIKGRDYYDFIWYISKNVKPDLEYLKGKLIESGIWKASDEFSLEDLKNLLRKRFTTTDWDQARKDVAPFIKDGRELEIWSEVFFNSLLQKLLI
jgi:hypothetical protein